jgi:hypothetical protein
MYRLHKIIYGLKECGTDTNLDSSYSLFVVLFSEGTNKKYGNVVYQFYFRYQNDVVPEDQSL